MKSVAIAKLKAELSHYLRLVKKGEEISVTDHRMVVAKIVPAHPAEPFRLEVVPAAKSAAALTSMVFAPVAGGPTDVVSALVEERRNSR